jgi:hypothetical protein
MERWVEITFDCLPLRTVGRLDVPLDAAPKFRRLYEAIKAAIERHGSHNTYFLYNARCAFHLANHPQLGLLEFEFDGTVLTDEDDLKTIGQELDVRLTRETCDWLTEPVVTWFSQTVGRAVMVEFDRYIAAGDLSKAKNRVERIRAQADEAGGYLGMYL